MTSATTGFNPQLTLTRIELPVNGSALKEHSTHLEAALRALDGVDEVKVNATTGRLGVRYDAGKWSSLRPSLPPCWLSCINCAPKRDEQPGYVAAGRTPSPWITFSTQNTRQRSK
jgi:cation transport ATPase